MIQDDKSLSLKYVHGFDPTTQCTKLALKTELLINVYITLCYYSSANGQGPEHTTRPFQYEYSGIISTI